MKYLDFNPVGSIITVIGLYNDLDEKRSIITFSKYDSDKDKWGFEETFDNMDLEDIYYVFSPSITPMPPETRLFKFNTNNSDDKTTSINSINQIAGIYDVKGIVNNLGNKPTTDIIFCTYVRKFNNVIPLNIFIDKDDNDNFSLYITSKKIAFDFPENHFGYNIPNHIFVMKNYPTNFKKTVLNMCIPTTGNDSEPKTIQECLNSLEVFDQNVNRLWNYNVNENKSNKNANNTINIIIISITVIISMLIIFLIIKKKRNK